MQIKGGGSDYCRSCSTIFLLDNIRESKKRNVFTINIKFNGANEAINRLSKKKKKIGEEDYNNHRL